MLASLAPPLPLTFCFSDPLETVNLWEHEEWSQVKRRSRWSQTLHGEQWCAISRGFIGLLGLKVGEGMGGVLLAMWLLKKNSPNTCANFHHQFHKTFVLLKQTFRQGFIRQNMISAGCSFLREAIPRKNLLRFGNCQTQIQIVRGTIKKKSLFWQTSS